MYRISAVLLVVLLLALGMAGCSDWRDKRAFKATEETALRSDITSEEAIEAYESYLARFPDGRYADTARQRIGKIAVAAAWDELRTALTDIVREEAYEEARQSLRELVSRDPQNVSALLQLGFLAWGFDDFRCEAWDESMKCADAVLRMEPGNEIALELEEHNSRYRPRSGDPARHPDISSMRVNRPYFLDDGLVLEAGQTARFSDDGIVESVTDANGKVVWRLEHDPRAGYVWVDGSGVRFLRSIRAVPFPGGLQREEVALVALTEITRTRKEILDNG